MSAAGRWTSGLLAILLSTSLTAMACQQDEATDTADDTEIVEDAGPALDVSDVALGRSIGSDMRVTEEVGDFAPTDTIYASVETSGTGSGTLSARWTFEDGQVVDEGSQSVSGAGVTEFHVSNPDGWPAGHYEVVISLDGDEVERSGFDVTVGG
ncbi:MAG TPA: hypothetical protein VJ982_13920 [Gemmatimonadota bacterium]|nr:hypothetical protein [Gemmatimonadota bacterium]